MPVCRYPVKAFRYFAGPDFSLKFGPRDAAVEPDKQFRAGCGVGNEPHLGLRIAFEVLRRRRGWMHLQRKFVLGVENFDEQREGLCVCAVSAQQRTGVILHEPAQ